MFYLLLLFFFVFGTIIGSFLNVVVLRYGTKTLSGRSACFSCGKTLRWFELIPILSFFFQKGRCRGCKSGISWQYPLVELITGLIFASIFLKHLSLLSLFSYSVILSLVIQLLLWSLLIALSVYDIRHKIIPDSLVYSACFISLLLFGISYFIFPASAEASASRHISFLRDFWSGFLLAAPFAALWFFSRGRAMGLGDAKLILLFPWFLGLAKGVSALIIGFWLGAAVSLGALFLKAVANYLPRRCCPNFRGNLRHLGMKTEFPLGPFLVIGLLLVYLFSWDVTGLGMLLASSG